MSDGLINDLFCHVLAVVSATVSNETYIPKNYLTPIEIMEVKTARYEGALISEETFAWINFNVHGITVQAFIGKCGGESQNKSNATKPKSNIEKGKSMIITGSKGSVTLDLSANNFIVTNLNKKPSKPQMLNSEPVKTFIEDALNGANPEIIPGVISFDASWRY